MEESLIADVGGSFTPPPAGNHVAICFGVVQLGTIETTYEGHKKRIKKIILQFELCGKLNEDGKPHIVNKEYTFSMNKKAGLRKMLVSWRGEDFTDAEAAKFNILNLVGAPCRINVIIKTSAANNKYADIMAVSALDDNDPVPVKVYPDVKFLITNPFKTDVFNALQEWMRNKIVTSDEYLAMANPGVANPAAAAATPPAVPPAPGVTPPVKKVPF